MRKFAIVTLWSLVFLMSFQLSFLYYYKYEFERMTDQALEERHILDKVDSSKYFYNYKFGEFERRVTFKDDNEHTYDFSVFGKPSRLDMLIMNFDHDYDLALEGYKDYSVQFDAKYNFLKLKGKVQDYKVDYE